jgi:hypothetical protein
MHSKFLGIVVRILLNMAVRSWSMMTASRCAHAAAVALVFVVLPGWPASGGDRLLDFGMFEVPSQSQLIMKSPVVRWLVRPDADSACNQAGPKDGYASRQEGCVYWHLSSNTCTIITTVYTTHSQMGHLFLRCLQGK